MNPKVENINDNVSIYQGDRSLAFGTDAYLLSAYVPYGSKKACELGAGSGVISLLCLKRNKITSSTCVEIQSDIARLCEINAVKNGCEQELSVLNTDLRSLPVSLNESFDTVFTNPPYMRADCGKMNDYEENAACRHEINGTVIDFCNTAARLLKFGGCFYAVYRPDRLSELMTACENARLRVKLCTLVYPTKDHVPSIVLVKAKKGAAPGMKMTKPLIIYPSRDNMSVDGYSENMKYIYENGDFGNEFR